MKKLILTLTALGVLTMSLLSVAASEVAEVTTEQVESRMDAETYLETRTIQLNDALAAGTITQEQYDLLLAHITDNSLEGAFGLRSQGENDSECVLGLEGQLGIFKSENSGMKNGQGNGVKQQVSDGSGNGSKSRGQNKGNGSNGMRLQDGSAENEECIID